MTRERLRRAAAAVRAAAARRLGLGAIVDAAGSARLTDAYFAHLASIAKPNKKIFVDIKYGHVHNFEISWWPSERRPRQRSTAASRHLEVDYS